MKIIYTETVTRYGWSFLEIFRKRVESMVTEKEELEK